MKLSFLRRSFQFSDEEIVERTRLSIAQCDRARAFFRPFYIVGFIALIWAWKEVVQVILQNLVNQPNAPLDVLLLIAGILLGLMFGWMTHGVIHGIFDSGRRERLLVKYYDALVAVADGKLAAVRESDRTADTLTSP